MKLLNLVVLSHAKTFFQIADKMRIPRQSDRRVWLILEDGK